MRTVGLGYYENQGKQGNYKNPRNNRKHNKNRKSTYIVKLITTANCSNDHNANINLIT